MCLQQSQASGVLDVACTFNRFWAASQAMFSAASTRSVAGKTFATPRMPAIAATQKMRRLAILNYWIA